jgi:hypothetical protein
MITKSDPAFFQNFSGGIKIVNAFLAFSKLKLPVLCGIHETITYFAPNIFARHITESG